MKKVILIICALVLLIMLLIDVLYKKGVQYSRNREFKKQIGIYKLDIYRTKMGVYQKDIERYKNLTIQFKKDSTFSMNFDVPFIFEKSGKWITDGGQPESWNYLYFKSWLSIRKIKIGEGNSFSSLYKMDQDSIFYLSAPNPKKNKDFIQEIYFVKQYPSSSKSSIEK